MSIGTGDDIALITPTYRSDLDRFAVLRESIMELGIEYPHLVVVDTEDRPLFERFADEPFVTLLTTREVVPRSIERGRVAAANHAAPYRRPDPRFWLLPKQVKGWKVQQIVKLAAPQLSAAKVFVAVDSDSFFVRPLDRRDVVGESSKPFLIETVADEAQTTSWLLSAMRALGVPLPGAPLHQYIHAPTILSRSVLLDVQRTLAAGSRRGWQWAFLRSGAAEYPLHGVQAALVDDYRSVEKRDTPVGLVWWTPDTFRSMEEFNQHVVTDSNVRAAALNSTLNLETHVHRTAARRLRELCAIEDGR